jgi:uncharacterized RDD family membrane protein YckC
MTERERDAWARGYATAIIAVIALALAVGRPFFPVTGHSSLTTALFFIHGFVWYLIFGLLRRGGRWTLGWLCLLPMSLVQAYMFFVVGPTP